MRKIIFLMLFIFCSSLFAKDNVDYEKDKRLIKARAYENGQGVEKDFRKAFEYYERSAHTNNPIAFKYLESRANCGIVVAQYYLGVYYFDPYGGQMDNDLAYFWFNKAAVENYTRAIWMLAHCTNRGIGVKKDCMEAFYLERLAEILLILKEDAPLEKFFEEQEKEHGHSHLRYSRDHLNFREPKKYFNEDFPELKEKAENGYRYEQARLGNEYFEGYFLNKNYEKAFNWWKKSAENGYASSMYAVGLCYFLGNGTEKNLEKAFEYFLKAEMADFPTVELARCYMEGWGTQADDKKALEVFTKVLNGHDKLAQELLDGFRQNEKLKNYQIKPYSKIYTIVPFGEDDIKPLD